MNISVALALVLGQVVLPVGLLTWLSIAWVQSRLQWAVIAFAAGSLLFALSAIGMWIIPPWWTLWAYALWWAVALTTGLRRWRVMATLPARPVGWTICGAVLAFALYVANEWRFAWRGGQPPPAPAYALQFPFREGQFLVLNGGNSIRINSHLATRDRPGPQSHRWRGNGYGIDLVAIDRWGFRASGLRPTDNRRYLTFDLPVLAPCAGRVLRVVDGLPDMTPPQYDTGDRLAGNHVILECDNLHVVLAHFRQDSVEVLENQIVAVGQRLARAGNSGGSDEPHLHLHVQYAGTPDAPLGADPVPALLLGGFVVRGDRLTVKNDGYLRWASFRAE